MHDDADPFFENLARELKKDPVRPSVDSRIMNAIRRTGMVESRRVLSCTISTSAGVPDAHCPPKSSPMRR